MRTADVGGWAWAGALAFAGLYLALDAGWTVRDLVWSFWLTTLTSGIFLSVVPAAAWGILAASHPAGRPHWIGITVFVAVLSSVFVVVLVLFHHFFLVFVGGLVPALHDNPRVTVARSGGGSLVTFAESAPVFYWRSLVAGVEAYWGFAVLTMLADAQTLPRTLNDWRGYNPLAAMSPLSERITRLMIVEAALLLLYIAAGLRDSMAFAAVFLLVHFLPSLTSAADRRHADPAR